jgi:hypothetical protein
MILLKHSKTQINHKYDFEYIYFLKLKKSE